MTTKLLMQRASLIPARLFLVRRKSSEQMFHRSGAVQVEHWNDFGTEIS